MGINDGDKAHIARLLAAKEGRSKSNSSSGEKPDYAAMDKKEAEYRAARKSNTNKSIL